MDMLERKDTYASGCEGGPGVSVGMRAVYMPVKHREPGGDYSSICAYKNR